MVVVVVCVWGRGGGYHQEASFSRTTTRGRVSIPPPKTPRMSSDPWFEEGCRLNGRLGAWRGASAKDERGSKAGSFVLYYVTLMWYVRSPSIAAYQLNLVNSTVMGFKEGDNVTPPADPIRTSSLTKTTQVS